MVVLKALAGQRTPQPVLQSLDALLPVIAIELCHPPLNFILCGVSAKGLRIKFFDDRCRAATGMNSTHQAALWVAERRIDQVAIDQEQTHSQATRTARAGTSHRSITATQPVQARCRCERIQQGHRAGSQWFARQGQGDASYISQCIGHNMGGQRAD